MVERALAIDEAVFGKDHPKLATRLNNLAVLLRDQGDRDGAGRHCKRALAISEAALGADHPTSRAIRANLAKLAAAEPPKTVPAARPPTPESEDPAMPETPPAGAGDTFNMTGTFHGPVFVKTTFQQAVSIAAGLPVTSAEKAELEKALAALAALLERVPEPQQPVAGKAAEGAKEVVEAARGGGRDLFDIAAEGLRAAVRRLQAAAPAVLDTAEKVISIAANLHGWR